MHCIAIPKRQVERLSTAMGLYFRYCTAASKDEFNSFPHIFQYHRWAFHFMELSTIRQNTRWGAFTFLCSKNSSFLSTKLSLFEAIESLLPFLTRSYPDSTPSWHGRNLHERDPMAGKVSTVQYHAMPMTSYRAERSSRWMILLSPIPLFRAL